MAASDERKPVTVLFADRAGSTELAVFAAIGAAGWVAEADANRL
jgi:class 3 adenylate cyclase